MTHFDHAGFDAPVPWLGKADFRELTMGWTMGLAAFCYRKSKVLPLSSQRQCTPHAWCAICLSNPIFCPCHKKEHPNGCSFLWGGRWDSNPRSSEPQSDALAN